MAETLRILLAVETEKKAARVLRELSDGGYATRHTRVKSLRPLKSALQRGSWDLIIADSRLWNILNMRDSRLLGDQPDLPVVLITEGADAALQAENSVRWGELAGLVPAIRTLLAKRAPPESPLAPGNRWERARAFLQSYLALLLSILVGAAASIGVFAYYQITETTRLRTDFQVIANDRAQAIRLQLAEHETVLNLLGFFYEATAEATRGQLSAFVPEFREFAQGVLAEDPDLQAVAIVPRLPDYERKKFEELARQGIVTGFGITQLGETGNMEPAGRRGDYYPVLVMEPQPRNAAILGLDLSTAPGLRETMEKARATGRLATSARNRLPYPRADAYAVWQFLPIYQDEEQDDGQSGARKLAAFAALVFRVDRLVELSLTDAAPSGIDLELVDTTASEDQRFSYFHRSRSPKPGARYEARTGNVLATTIDPGGRTWTLYAYATYGFVARHRTWQSWILLIAGLLFTSATGTYFARRIRQVGQIERLVEQRTLALSREIEKQRRLQQELESSRQTLTVRVAELDQRNREIQLLNELGDVFQACVSTEEAYPVVALYAPRLLPTTSGALYVHVVDQDLLTLAAEWGNSPPQTSVFKPEDCWGLRLGRMHAVHSVPGRLPCRHAPSAAGNRSLCVPLSAMGETIGLFHLTGCAETAQDFAVSVAEHIGLALSNLKLRSELRQLSIHDPLTNLHNRRYMEEALELELRRAERKKLTVGLIMLDIDHFKAFNDGFGHAAGDELLRSLGALLREHLRSGDVACRYGGEEFLLILPEATPAATTKRAEELRRQAKDLSITYLDQPLGPVSISLGVAVYPGNGGSAEEVIRAADSALYRAKAEGRDRVAVAGPAAGQGGIGAPLGSG